MLRFRERRVNLDLLQHSTLYRRAVDHLSLTHSQPDAETTTDTHLQQRTRSSLRMSWSDLFFPGNPGRREEVIRLGQQLLSCMTQNFNATNRLSKLLNTEFKCSLPHITLNNQASIRENCDTLIGAISKIQKELTHIDEKLKAKLDPELYKKLRDISTPISDRIKIASQALTTTMGIVTMAATVAVVELINKGVIFSRIVSTLGRISTCTVAMIGLGVLGFAIDAIASAILGAIEKSNLETVIQEYKDAVEKFTPSSEQYQDNIIYVIVKLEVMQEK